MTWEKLTFIICQYTYWNECKIFGFLPDVVSTSLFNIFYLQLMVNQLEKNAKYSTFGLIAFQFMVHGKIIFFSWKWSPKGRLNVILLIIQYFAWKLIKTKCLTSQLGYSKSWTSQYFDTSTHFDFYLIGPNFEYATATLGIKILCKIFVWP